MFFIVFLSELFFLHELLSRFTFKNLFSPIEAEKNPFFDIYTIISIVLLVIFIFLVFKIILFKFNEEIIEDFFKPTHLTKIRKDNPDLYQKLIDEIEMDAEKRHAKNRPIINNPDTIYRPAPIYVKLPLNFGNNHSPQPNAHPMEKSRPMGSF